MASGHASPASPPTFGNEKGALACRLKKIPFVAKRIGEDGNGAVGLPPWLFEKADAFGRHVRIIPVKIIGLKKEPHPATGLLSQSRLLVGRRGHGQQKSGGGPA